MNCDVCNAEVLSIPPRDWQELQVCTACHRALSRAVLIGVQPARMAVTCRDCEQVASGDARACPCCACEFGNLPDGWPRLPQDALQPLPESEAARLRETEEELIASSKPEVAALLANCHSQQSYQDAYDRLRDELTRLRMARQAASIQSTGAFSEDYERALIRTSEAIVGYKLDFVTRYIWARWPGHDVSDGEAEQAEPAPTAATSPARVVFSSASRAAVRRYAPFVITGCLLMIGAYLLTQWIIKSQPVVNPPQPEPTARQEATDRKAATAAANRRAQQDEQIKLLQAELAKVRQEAAEARAQAAGREPAKAQATDEPRTVAFVLDQTDSMRKPPAPGQPPLTEADARQSFEVAKAEVLDAISQLDDSERFCIVAYGAAGLEQFPSVGSEPAGAGNKERAALFLHDLHLGAAATGPTPVHPYAALVHALYRNPHEIFVHAGAYGSTPHALSSLELESLLLHNQNRNAAPIHFRTYGEDAPVSPA